MGKLTKQTEAASTIRELLRQRGLDIPSRSMTLPDNQRWVVFKHNERQVGIDTAAGVWLQENDRSNWSCISMPCTVSGALQAVDFLTKE
jgi:hypothetical protein